MIANLIDAEGEDQFRELMDGTLRLLEKHYDLADDVDSEVQHDPDQKRPSLHGRLSFTFLSEGSREQHYCFRLLEHSNARAFQTRLKAAMTASGIDTALKFRHLFILRRGAPPSGPRTTALFDQFLKAGGKFIAPTDGDLRAFVALAAMDARKLPDFDAWLRQQQPLFKTRLFQEAGLCPPPFLAPNPPAAPDELAPPPQDKPTPAEAKPAPTQTPVGAQAEKPKAPPAAPRKPAASERLIPIGRRYERGALGDPVTLATDLLPRHVAVLAGPGSGKTVLLRRIVEEAALLGIPSIVLDPNNDLSRLGDAWPTRPEFLERGGRGQGRNVSRMRRRRDLDARRDQRQPDFAQLAPGFRLDRRCRRTRTGDWHGVGDADPISAGRWREGELKERCPRRCHSQFCGGKRRRADRPDRIAR